MGGGEGEERQGGGGEGKGVEEMLGTTSHQDSSLNVSWRWASGLLGATRGVRAHWGSDPLERGTGAEAGGSGICPVMRSRGGPRSVRKQQPSSKGPPQGATDFEPVTGCIPHRGGLLRNTRP